MTELSIHSFLFISLIAILFQPLHSGHYLCIFQPNFLVFFAFSLYDRSVFCCLFWGLQTECKHHRWLFFFYSQTIASPFLLFFVLNLFCLFFFFLSPTQLSFVLSFFCVLRFCLPVVSSVYIISDKSF